MRAALLVLSATVAAIRVSAALGCSCVYPSDVKTILRKANVAVLAEVTSITQHPSGRAGTIIEDDTFRVILAFKGNLRAGDLFRVRSIINPVGQCGASAKNSPVWIVDGRQPLRLSGVWVIYGMGMQPFELSICGPSKPIEAGGVGDLEQLLQMAETKDRAGAH